MKIREQHKNYKYNCSSFYFLQLESEQLPIPDQCKMITVPPEENDLALVNNKIEYIFKDGKWVENK